MNWPLCLTISLLILPGCAGREKPEPLPKVVTQIEYVYADCGVPPPRMHIDLRPIKWRILEVNGEQLFTLTPDMYKDMSHNTSQTIGGTKELKAEIQYYLDCVKRPPAPEG